MLSRRLIRVKVFKVLFAHEFSQKNSVDLAEKELLNSFEDCRKLYYFLLNVCSSVVRVAEDRIEVLKNKFHPTEEEANPNYKFVNNQFVEFLESEKKFQDICKNDFFKWTEYDVFVRKLYSSIVASDYYKEYMQSPVNSFEEDCSLFKRIFEEEFEDNEMLEKILEEKSVYWIDDLAYVLNIILWSIDNLAKTKKLNHPNLFIDDEDEDFAMRLLRSAILNYDDHLALITQNVSNWDSDRLVLTDASLIVLGLSEAIVFPEIPIKVTINEYVEIAKYYSTQNSRIFVNGLLDRLIQAKRVSGEIVKTGRGLCEGN